MKKEAIERERLAKAEREVSAKILAELKAKEDAERKAIAVEEMRIQSELNKSDAAKVKDMISDLNAFKTKFEFRSHANKAKYRRVGLLIDKIILDIQRS